MATTLMREPISMQVASGFYLRRIRRIVPTLLVVTTLTTLFGRWLLFSADIAELVDATLPALTFTTNLVAANKDDNNFEPVCPSHRL